MKFFFVSSLVILSLAMFSVDDNPEKQPVELGSVSWNKDLDKAFQLAKEHKRPLFVQFQEVPG